ncbi:hypothetical protein M3Y94_00704900 [Aphelenchoides besseyi]|nr:hypothetical protein M3Y94_00704900 [Aphelenchoides besseyi]KAI6231652.1 hypothetical protein M3Y95_00404500 [Aphelenchoides besseyi]
MPPPNGARKTTNVRKKKTGYIRQRRPTSSSSDDEKKPKPRRLDRELPEQRRAPVRTVTEVTEDTTSAAHDEIKPPIARPNPPKTPLINTPITPFRPVNSSDDEKYENFVPVAFCDPNAQPPKELPPPPNYNPKREAARVPKPKARSENDRRRGKKK